MAKERASACTTDDAVRLVFGETMYDMLALEASSHPVNCLKILGTSAGVLYPPDKMHPNKRFVLSQDILEMILRSTVSPDEILSGSYMRKRLWERFGIIVGGSTYELEKLQNSGMLLQIDEDSLERNLSLIHIYIQQRQTLLRYKSSFQALISESYMKLNDITESLLKY